MKKILLPLVLFFCFGLFAEAAPAAKAAPDKQSEAQTALELLETKEQILEKWANVNPKKGSEKYAKKDKEIKQVVEDIIDYRFISEYIIGKKWAETPESQKEALFNKVKELFTEVYLDKIFYNKSYEKKYLDKGVESKYIKGVPESVFITSEMQFVVKRKSVAYEIIYHLRKVDGAYKIFDVELDTVSLDRNYREQFEKKLKEQSVPELIKLLDNKIASEKQGKKKAPAKK